MKKNVKRYQNEDVSIFIWEEKNKNRRLRFL